MAERRHWAGVAVRDGLPFDTCTPDPHPASAAAKVGGLTYCSSILPWRSCGTGDPWRGSTVTAKTQAATRALVDALPPGETIWGGDWNHALRGRGVRRQPRRAPGHRRGVGGAGADRRYRDLPHRVKGLSTIDHAPSAASAFVAATLLGAASLATTGTAIANPGGQPAIPLNTEQETTGSNTGASGFFTFTISGTQLCYTLTARDLSASAVAAHIHRGPRSVAGPVVIPLTVAPGTSCSHSACTTASPTLLAAIQAEPKAYYVNVHTPTFPGGEICGQLK